MRGRRAVHSVCDLSFDGFEGLAARCQRICSFFDAGQVERDLVGHFDALEWVTVSLSRKEAWRHACTRLCARMDGALAPYFLTRQFGLALVNLDDAIAHFDILLLWLFFLQLVMEELVPFSLFALPPCSSPSSSLFLQLSLLSFSWAHGRVVAALLEVIIIFVVCAWSEIVSYAFVVVFSASGEFQLSFDFFSVGLVQDLGFQVLLIL